MRSHARAVVIGGGIGGCSALYHLTREGWRDVVLVERDELTSGTTWHSAAQCPNLAPNQLLIALRSYTIALYKELADDPGYPIDYHHAVGGLRLIRSQAQLGAVHHVISAAKGVGVDFELIGPGEIARRHPLLNTEGVIAALWDELDGDIDPAQLCQALARRARAAGAEIQRFNPVVGLTQKPDHTWVVHTKKGDIACEHIVNAAGYRVNEVGALMDVAYPVVSMEHMYLITEPIAALEEREGRVPIVRCPTDTFYMRQEKAGLLVGVYEMDCKTWGLEGIDPEFVNALCPNDLDRCLDKLTAISERVPCLGEAGIKSMVTGPITYAPDGGPLIGKLPGRRNAWSMNGLRVGIGEGGGYGKVLAQMMVHGEAEWDCWQFDPRRLTRHANSEYTALKAIEDYRNEFRWHRPREHRPAGRPAKTTPIYPLLKAAGAAFGVVNGWERASFFAPDPEFVEDHGFRFPNWHKLVAEEVKAVTERVGLLELSGFNRYEIRGRGAEAWLDGLMCGPVPREPGKVGLCYFLTEKGNVLGEATLALLGEDHLWYGSAAAAEDHDRDWLRERLPPDGEIALRSLTNTTTTLVVAGPRSRALLQEASPRGDWTAAGFPWLSARRCAIGQVGIGHAEALALSVSFSGELAWELHIPNEQLTAAYCTLTAAGAAYGLAHFGTYALESMRLEKGYRHWKAELTTEFNPMETGLGRFVRMNRSFPGKAGLQSQLSQGLNNGGLKKKLVTLAIESSFAPAQPEDAVLQGETLVGSVTSAAWGHRVGRNLAMAFIDPAHAGTGTRLEVLVPGRRLPAAVCESCLYDPQNLKPRSRDKDDGKSA